MDYKIGDIMLVDKKIYAITNINNIYVELREFKVQENKIMVFTGEVLTVSSARLQEKDVYKVKYRPGDMVKSRDGHIEMIDNIFFYQSLQSPMYEYHYLGEEESYRISSKSYDTFNLQKFNFSEGDILKYDNDEVVLVDIKDNIARYKRLEALTGLDYYHMDLRNPFVIHLGNINDFKYKSGDKVMLANESIVTIENIYLGVDNEFRYSCHYVEGGLSFTCYASNLESSSSKIEPLDEPKKAFEYRFSIGDKLYHKGRLIEIVDIKPLDDRLYYHYTIVRATDKVRIRVEVPNFDSWVKDKVVLEYIPTGVKVEAELTSEGYIATLGSVPVNITNSNLLESFKEVRIEDLDLKYKPGDLVQDTDTGFTYMIEDIYYKADWSAFVYSFKDISTGYQHEEVVECLDELAKPIPSSIDIDTLKVSYLTKNLKDEEFLTNFNLDGKNINLTPNEVKTLIEFLEQQLDVYNAINEEESDE